MALTIRDYLERGPATSREIQVATNLSQTAVSLQLRDMEDSVIKLDKTRPPRYVLTRNAFGGDDKLPLVTVDPHGNTVQVAVVRPLSHGGFYIESAAGMSRLLLGEGGDGLYDDLPYFLSDLRPQGFLGRQIASDLASQTGDFPSDPRRWNANHVGRYLISNGEDLPGNFKFGQQSLSRVRRPLVVTSRADYPKLADSVMSGENPGTSAGGEQPKFTAFCDERASHVIVKFSPKGASDSARRWRDILITEFHATEVLHAKGIPAIEAKLMDIDDRIYLESKRFDRSNEYGRISMISLIAIDAEFVGSGGSWVEVVNKLETKKLVSWNHLYDVEYAAGFGALINNTDMHLGNLSFGIDGDVFRLLPVYDMCSMGFAPNRNGEVSRYNFTPSKYQGINVKKGNVIEIKRMAHDFWERVTGDERISAEFRAFLEQGNPIDRNQQIKSPFLS